MAAISFLILSMAFLLGYFRQWRVTAAIVGLLALWLIYSLYLDWTGDLNGPTSNKPGAEYLPYLQGALIAGISLVHGIGRGVRYLKTRLDSHRAKAKIGETFE